MNQDLRNAKQAIRAFWPNYTTERLVWLLEHARSGKLSYFSCCCFIGIVTADHALQGDPTHRTDVSFEHIERARGLPCAVSAERAFERLGQVAPNDYWGWSCGQLRRRRIISMVKAEIRRREREWQQQLRDMDESEKWQSKFGMPL